MSWGAFYNQDLAAVEGKEKGVGASLRLRVRNQVNVDTFLKPQLANSLYFSEFLSNTRGTRWTRLRTDTHPRTWQHLAHGVLWWGGTGSGSTRAHSSFQPGPQGPSSVRLPCSYDAMPLFPRPSWPPGWLLLERFLFQPLTLDLAVLETQFCLHTPCLMRKHTLSAREGQPQKSPVSPRSLRRLTADQIPSSWTKKYLKNNNKGEWRFSKGISIKRIEVCFSAV